MVWEFNCFLRSFGVLKYLRFFFIEFYRRKRSILMSVAIAFVAWFVAIIVTDRQSTVIISNVPVEADLANTQTEQLGFDLIKINP